MRYFSIYILLCLCVCLASCYTAQNTTKQQLALPAQFANQSADSSSWANLNWKQFFVDPQLQQLIDSALIHNHSLNAVVQQVESARAFYQASRQKMFPTLGVQAGASVQKYGDYTPNGLGTRDQAPQTINGNTIQLANPANDFGLYLSSTWEVDIWGKLNASKKAAKARLEASGQALRLAQTILISQLAKAYYQLLAIDEEILIVEKNYKLQEAAYDITKAQQAAGRVTLLAVQKFESQLFNTKAQHSLLKREQATAEQTINLLAGRLPTAVQRSASIRQQGNKLPIQVGVPSQLLLNRPDVAEASLQLQAAGFDVSSAQKAFYPSISINPLVGFNALKSSLLFNSGSLSYSIAGGVFAPLFDQYVLRGQLKAKEAEQKQAFLMYEKSIINAVSEVQTSLTNLNYCKLQIKDKSSEVAVLDSAVNTAKDLFLYGYANYFEVITAQKDVLSSEMDLIESLKDELFLYTDLFTALGGGR